jgi:site-specific recombinase XerC
VKPPHVATYIEGLTVSKPEGGGAIQAHDETTLTALRMLFDRLVVAHVLDVNPARAVRGPKYSQKKGKTPVLDRTFIAAIDTSSLTGLGDRALIGVIVYSFARAGAMPQDERGDYFSLVRRWVRLDEKGGKIGGKRSLETMTPEERTKKHQWRQPGNARWIGWHGPRKNERSRPNPALSRMGAGERAARQPDIKDPML